MRVVKRLCSRVRIFDSLDSTASEPALVQGYVSRGLGKGPAGTSSAAYVAATVPSRLDQIFYLSAMYLVSRQTFLSEKTLVVFFGGEVKTPSG